MKRVNYRLSYLACDISILFNINNDTNKTRMSFQHMNKTDQGYLVTPQNYCFRCTAVVCLECVVFILGNTCMLGNLLQNYN